MKILIFKHENALLEYLTTQKDSTAVLDLTGSAKVKAAVPRVHTPGDFFKPGEKEKVRDEYIEVISEMGAHHEYSLYWQSHPISEKNDLAPDHLFDRLVDFITFSRAMLGMKEECLAVLPKRDPLVRDIREYAASRGIPCRESGEAPVKKGPLRKLGSIGKRQLTMLAGVIKTQAQYRRSRYIWNRIDKTKTYTVIRTWFDSRSPDLLKKTEDIYFGKLPAYLRNQGKEVLYFGEIIYGFEHIFGHIRQEQQNPVLLARSLLKGADFYKAHRFQAAVKRKIKLETGIRILGIEVDRVIKRYFLDYAGHEQVRANYLTYLAAAKLVRRLKIEAIYMPYENYAWEKLTRCAVSNYAEKIKVVAFQHAQVALNATKFFIGRAESHPALLPGKLVTLGEVTRDILIRHCHYPPQKLETGCALRQNYTAVGGTRKRTGNKRILVQLWSVEKSARMINFLHASRVHPEPYRLTLNFHPCNPLEKLLPHLDFNYENHFPTARGTLEENFQNHDLVIYHGTTTCLDALANGVPVLEVEFDDFITVDPLFAFSDFKWTVREPGELAEVIEKIYALSDEEYYRGQQKGYEFVRKYFYPVTEENLKGFIA